MAILAKELIENIIRPALSGIGMARPEAEQLLAGTCAQESQMGTYLRQDQGPALGIWQMEPKTHKDIWDNYLKYRPELVKQIIDTCWMPKIYNVNAPDDALIYNLKYACLMARVKYMRDKEGIPLFGNIEAQAFYWKNVYNSTAGKGDTAAYIQNYNRFVKPYYTK
jgi:hypothetical protein